ncbi:MAG: DUF6266 family protein [Clostridia bacterium]|jgi:hypothetical protein|nr:DUF6266 family protein [Clostridia bacterium]
MAIAKNGILGGFSGSVGDIVGATWKGVTTIRSKSAIEKKPLTQKQKDALQTTKLVLDFWKETNTMYPWLDLTSKELGMTPMNVFQRRYRGNVLASATSLAPFTPFDHFPTKILAYEWYAPTPGTTSKLFDGEFTEAIISQYPTHTVDITVFQFRRVGGSAKLYKVWRNLNTPVSDEGVWFSMQCDVRQEDQWLVSVMLKSPESQTVIGTQQRKDFS